VEALMLFIVIGLLVVWLLMSLVCVGLCVNAARGDRGMAKPAMRLSPGPRRFSRDFHPAA
jgi:uncharacterized iron-regulated membrane protein